MKEKPIFLFLFYLLSVLNATSQKIAGLYKGEKVAAQLKIDLDSTVTFSTRYDCVSFDFKCKVIKVTDTTLQIENTIATSDSIICKGKRREKDAVKVNFIAINSAMQSRRVKLDYEIAPCTTNDALQSIRFFLNHRVYCYYFKKTVKSITVYIDAENSFLITDWKIRGNQLVPDVNEKVNESLTLTKKGE